MPQSAIMKKMPKSTIMKKMPQSTIAEKMPKSTIVKDDTIYSCCLEMPQSRRMKQPTVYKSKYHKKNIVAIMCFILCMFMFYFVHQCMYVM